MKNRRIDGIQLEKMLRNGLANLRLHEDEVNKLNVFPVPDGDTGTNMCATLENGINYAKSGEVVGNYTRGLSDGMLFGARGNSGVILSQFFKGFYLQTARCSYLGPGELRNALVRGYRSAYDSVVTPVEGTILTVVREGIENIRSQITRYTTIEELLSMYIAEMKKSLSYTPELLDVLKESGVIDSGAQGFIYIAEGMLMYLYGKKLTGTQPAAAQTPQSTEAKTVDFSLFNENSKFELGYCTEFILQLLNDPAYNRRFHLNTFIEDLQKYGNSLVVVQDGKRVKVHVHTLRPERIIAMAREYGEFLTFKLENMQLQHNEVISSKEKPEHKPMAIVAVVNGEGLKKVFKELGADVVICCEETMNASTQEFADAFAQLNADRIVVLPNNSNVIWAADQAVKLCEADNVTVLHTSSVAEGYFALAMDVPDSEPDFRIASMREGIESVVTLSQTTATRDFSMREITCRTGDEIVVDGDNVIGVSDDWLRCIIDSMKLLPNIDELETCAVFGGESVTDEQLEALTEAFEENFPLMDVEFMDGGQKIYRWVIGLS